MVVVVQDTVAVDIGVLAVLHAVTVDVPSRTGAIHDAVAILILSAGIVLLRLIGNGVTLGDPAIGTRAIGYYTVVAAGRIVLGALALTVVVDAVGIVVVVENVRHTVAVCIVIDHVHGAVAVDIGVHRVGDTVTVHVPVIGVGDAVAVDVAVRLVDDAVAIDVGPVAGIARVRAAEQLGQVV